MLKTLIIECVVKNTFDTGVISSCRSHTESFAFANCPFGNYRLLKTDVVLIIMSFSVARP